MTYLYVIAKKADDGLCGPVKVGISATPAKRLSTIQTACPFPITLAYTFECPDRNIALAMEESFHKTQARKRLYGEWFDYTPREAINVLCMAFHVALAVNLNGHDDLIEECLEFSGVRAAEKLLGMPRLGFSE